MVKKLGIEARAWAIHRIATGHPKGHGLIAWDAVHQFYATMVRSRCRGKISLRQAWAWMGQRVDFQRESFLEPGLELRLLRVYGNRHDAHWSAAIDLLQPFQDRAQKSF